MRLQASDDDSRQLRRRRQRRRRQRGLIALTVPFLPLLSRALNSMFVTFGLHCANGMQQAAVCTR